MPLDRNTLENKILSAFQKAQDTKPPDDPNQSKDVQKTILINLSKDIADAINAFVINGDIANLKTNVTVNLNNGQGTGTQDGVIHLT